RLLQGARPRGGPLRCDGQRRLSGGGRQRRCAPGARAAGRPPLPPSTRRSPRGARGRDPRRVVLRLARSGLHNRAGPGGRRRLAAVGLYSSTPLPTPPHVGREPLLPTTGPVSGSRGFKGGRLSPPLLNNVQSAN